MTDDAQRQIKYLEQRIADLEAKIAALPDQIVQAVIMRLTSEWRRNG